MKLNSCCLVDHVAKNYRSGALKKGGKYAGVEEFLGSGRGVGRLPEREHRLNFHRCLDASDLVRKKIPKLDQSSAAPIDVPMPAAPRVRWLHSPQRDERERPQHVV